LPHKLPHAAQQTWASPEIIFDHSEVALNGNAIVRTRPIFWEWQGTQREPDYWPRLAVREGDWEARHNYRGQADSRRVCHFDGATAAGRALLAACLANDMLNE